jgi:protein-S-isoprenylcysteine O-methyltransferase Ste14
MNDLSPSDFSGLLHAHQKLENARRFAELDDDYRREIPLRGLYLYVRNFLFLLFAGMSVGIITYLWSLT